VSRLLSYDIVINGVILITFLDCAMPVINSYGSLSQMQDIICGIEEHCLDVQEYVP
jgi:hypothetical protein